MNPMLMTDFYKISHYMMTAKGTEKIYSTFTPRKSRIPKINKVVFFGLQGFIKEFLIDYFNDNFFNKDKDIIVNDYKRIITHSLGEKAAETSHIEALHDLGFLPIKICSLPEGIRVPIRVPLFTIENTKKEFYWLTNFLETLISACMWKPITSTTICGLYKDICTKWAKDTCDGLDHVQFQCHNFSYRGMHSNHDAITTGAGHAIFFTGSDSIPSIPYLEEYYGANVEKELVLTSIPATEHSIQCQYQDDYKYIKRMITEIVPEGLVSIVADGYDYWNVVGGILHQLKDEIMERDGKTVIRPDSGDPVEIICGRENSPDELLRKGTIDELWDVFGGTINSKGYRVLDPHISVIYGEAITPEIAEEIFTRLEQKGYASENVVFGIGSYSLGYVTRDTFGMAIKATYTVIDGEEVNIYKDPKTDIDGMKKSQTGMVSVLRTNGQYHFVDELNQKRKELYEIIDRLKPIFKDGKMLVETTLQEIRERVDQNDR